ncbi:HAD hydrolase family protein [Bacillus sp. EB600]|uniref:HAD hydrolase family protein n=1 Tax=Bacillus sp. EB600 TaxID=2806345 RepID=UPI0035C210E6|nr:HAD hydrolase family protein [Bacillus sp. EB600]
MKVVIATGGAPYFSKNVVNETNVDSTAYFNGAYACSEGKEIYINAIYKYFKKYCGLIS